MITPAHVTLYFGGINDRSERERPRLQDCGAIQRSVMKIHVSVFNRSQAWTLALRSTAVTYAAPLVWLFASILTTNEFSSLILSSRKR
jgi:hypothetical protein